MEQQKNSTIYNISIENAVNTAIGDGASVLPQAAKASVQFTPANLFMAAQKVTLPYVHNLLHHQSVVPRNMFNQELQNFLDSSARYAVITGASGVGKSTVMAIHARDLLADGWATFFMGGVAFSLDYLAALIAKDGLGHVGELEWRQVFISPWHQPLTAPVKGMLLLIDAIDQANAEVIALQFTQLYNASHHVPPTQFKLLVSCSNSTWEHERLPFFQARGFMDHSGVRVLELSNFTESELTSGLHSIGADELTAIRQPGAPPDAHAESLRELLNRPAIFRLYAERSKSTTERTLADISWSSLVVDYFQGVIQKVSAQFTTLSPYALQEQLITLAQMARRDKSCNFLLDKGKVREALPDLLADDTDPRRSPYALMRELGLLIESPLPAGRRSVRFAIADVASYLLSLSLEREAEQTERTETTLEEMITNWINESLNDFPLIDALLLWIDRLVDKPRNQVLQQLLARIIESHAVLIDIAFRILRPEVLDVLFEIVAATQLDYFHRYCDAATSLRFLPAMGGSARKRLYSHSTQARQLAVHYLGKNRDVSAIEPFIELLEEEDRDTRQYVYRALVNIGGPALPSLLTVISNPDESSEKRNRCLVAIRGIGTRNEEVSTVLSSCLQESFKTENQHLLREALLAASALRDRRQTPYAIQALEVADWHVMRNAAKVLAELPSADALSALQNAYNRTSTNAGGDLWQKEATLQILAAIAAIQMEESTAYTLEKFVESFKGAGGLHPVFALSLAQKSNIPGADAIVVETLWQSLANDPSGDSSGRVFDWIAERWQPRQLLAIAQSAHVLQQQGKDITKLTVDAIVASESVEHSHHLHDHHQRLDALHALAKCQPANFVEEVIRLVDCPGRWHFDEEVCNALWVVADGRAEQGLINRLEHLLAQTDTPCYSFLPVVRALGTCGTHRCLPVLFNYLKNATELERRVPEQCLYPLAQRGQIAPEHLIEWANNSHAQSNGRVAALITLGMLNASQYGNLFDTLLYSADDSLVLGYAAKMAGIAGNSTSIPHLSRLLRTTEDAFTANHIVGALTELDATDTVPLIENIFENNYAETEHTLDFINALEYFHQPSSLPLLLAVLEKARNGNTEYAIINALGAFLPDPLAMVKIMEWLETWHGANFDAGQQRIAAQTLARYSPPLLVEQANRLYANGRLYPSTRREIARWLPYLAKHIESNHSELVILVKRVLSDTDFVVREVGGIGLVYVDQGFCTQIYNAMSTASDNWMQACAVRMLGFWGNHESHLKGFRYAEECQTRYFADVALAKSTTRHKLAPLAQMYQSDDGLTRLSAYLAIQRHGNSQTIRTLSSEIHQENIAYLFLDQLSSDVYKRIEKERKDEAKKEEKVLTSAGTVYYD